MPKRDTGQNRLYLADRNRPTIECAFGFRFDVQDLQSLSAEQCRAVMDGIARVLSAQAVAQGAKGGER